MPSELIRRHVDQAVEVMQHLQNRPCEPPDLVSPDGSWRPKEMGDGDNRIAASDSNPLGR